MNYGKKKVPRIGDTLVQEKMRLIGIEPTHAAPEATALSTELQTHLCNHTLFKIKLQGFYFAGMDCFLRLILLK